MFTKFYIVMFDSNFVIVKIISLILKITQKNIFTIQINFNYMKIAFKWVKLNIEHILSDQKCV